VDPQIILPFGSLYNAQLGGVRVPDSSGIGDPLLAATVWLINKPDPVYSSYFAITPFLGIPLGAYNNANPVNLGTNRWRGIIQAGLNQGIAPNLLIDLYADVTFNSENRNGSTAGAVFRQDPSFELQAWLRYNVTPQLSLAAGYAYNFGGAQ